MRRKQRKNGGESEQGIVYEWSRILSAASFHTANPTDDLRCKRSDGKQWRCTARSMPNKTVCEKCYIQAKKRAANSAMRANLKKGKRKSQSYGDSDVFLESKSEDFDAPLSTALNNNNNNNSNNHRSGKKLFDQVSKNQFRYTPNSDARNGSSSHHAPKDGDDSRDRENGNEDEDVDLDVPLDEDNSGSDESEHGSGDGRSRGSLDANATTEYSDGTSDSSQNTGGQTCHLCRKNVRDRVTLCLKCDRREYCDRCISTW